MKLGRVLSGAQTPFSTVLPFVQFKQLFASLQIEQLTIIEEHNVQTAVAFEIELLKKYPTGQVPFTGTTPPDGGTGPITHFPLDSLLLFVQFVHHVELAQPIQLSRKRMQG